MLLAFGTLAHILQHGISDVGYNICVRVGSYRGRRGKEKNLCGRKHKHGTSRLIRHLAKPELLVPFF